MKKRLGFIGFGLRSQTMLHAFHAIDAELEVALVADPRYEQLKDATVSDPYFTSTRWFDSPEALFERMDALDGVFIGTRCSLHTPLAERVLQEDVPLFLEKPVCISQEQYQRLKAAAAGKTGRVVVSFPLRVSAIVEEMRQIVLSGRLGRLAMVQAVNNVPYGSVYYHSWYRDPAETGGLFLQKATHDMDYIHYLTGQVPVDAYARTAKVYFKGDRPAGLRCPDCPDYRCCPESSYVVGRIRKDDVQGDCCCFAVDTGNEDQASAIFTCESGLIISYSQNFMVKKGAARRGCRIIGTEGSAEFDFYSGVIREDRYETAQTVTHTFQTAAGQHFGGDERLALEFMGLLDGVSPKADLAAGLDSAAVCLAAAASAKSGLPCPVQR